MRRSTPAEQAAFVAKAADRIGVTSPIVLATAMAGAGCAWLEGLSRPR